MFAITMCVCSTQGRPNFISWPWFPSPTVTRWSTQLVQPGSPFLLFVVAHPPVWFVRPMLLSYRSAGQCCQRCLTPAEDWKRGQAKISPGKRVPFKQDFTWEWICSPNQDIENILKLGIVLVLFSLEPSSVPPSCTKSILSNWELRN